MDVVIHEADGSRAKTSALVTKLDNLLHRLVGRDPEPNEAEVPPVVVEGEEEEAERRQRDSGC